MQEAQIDLDTSRCRVCDESHYLVSTTKPNAIAQVCSECFSVCPQCDGEGFSFETDERGYSMAVPCRTCAPLFDRINRFNQASIPSRYCLPDNGGTLQTYRVLCYQNANNTGPIGNLSTVHQKLFRFADRFLPGEKGFLLHGRVGCGKTHLMSVVLRELTLEKGLACRFVEFTHLLRDLKEQYDQGKGESEIILPLVEIDVLAIDELGKGRSTDWEISVLDEIISNRYNRGLTTLFTTNYRCTREERESQLGQNQHLQERVGARIFSRLCEMTDFIEIDAPDFRA